MASSLFPMSDKRTIMIDSSYRDRVQYPLSSDFIIPFQYQIGTTIWDSTNPVTASYPVYAWQWTLALPFPFKGIITEGTPSTPIVDSTIQSIVELAMSTNNSATTIENAENMFRNLIFVVDKNTYRVTGYDASVRAFSLDKAIVNFVIGMSYELFNVSTITSSMGDVVLQGYNLVYLGEGSNTDGYSVTSTSSLFLWDLNLNIYTPVMLRNEILQFPITSSIWSSWKPNDCYFLFSNEPPLSTQRLASLGYIIPVANNTLVIEYKIGSSIEVQTLTLPFLTTWTPFLIAETLSLSNVNLQVTFSIQTQKFVLQSSELFRISTDSTCLSFLGDPPTLTTFNLILESQIMIPFYEIATFGQLSSISSWSLQSAPEQLSSSTWLNNHSHESRFLIVNEQGIGNAVLVWEIESKSLRLVNPGSNYQLNGTYFIIPEKQYGIVLSAEQIESLPRINVTEILPVVGLDLPISDVRLSSSFVGQYLFPTVWSPLFSDSRFEMDTQTITNGLFTNTIGTFPPKSPHDRNVTLNDLYTWYGVQPIRHVYYDPKSSLLYVQLSNMSTLQLQRLRRLSQNLSDSFYQSVGTTVGILKYTKDTVSPLDYTGSTVSQNQMVCYTLEISSLILPNETIDSPVGGLTSSYPYVFLEITNESASSAHNRNVLFSNNPNATSATFLLPISDVNNPSTTKFIKLYSGGHQQVKFKPNDNLRFRVFFPDGSSFETTRKDYLPPLLPNPLLQIAMIMEIQRLV